MSEVVTAPQGYICPITCDLMVNPVIDPDGNSYEKVAITEWLKSSTLSPITRKPLDVSKLVPNRALQEAIEAFKTSNPHFGLPVGMLPSAPSSDSSGATSNSTGPTDDTLAVCVMRNAESIHVAIKAAAEREPTTQTSSDICCVVDTSGSMGREVQLKSESGVSESYGINVLDLVKHAMKTIVECLTERDRLSLVAFNHSAKLVFDLTTMNDQGKAFAKRKIDEMQPDGGTNLYDGLIKGLDVLCAEAGRNRNSSVFLLTDGVASTEPPRGTIPALKRYIDEKAGGNLSCTINTFGFGYDLDQELLQALAYEGSGAFSFIPDGSFVGTIFINALSNFLSTVAKDVTLSIENTDSNAALNTELTKHCKHEVTSWGVLYRFGSITYGQSKDLIIGYSNPSTTSDIYCEYSLSYTKVISNTKAEVKTVPCRATVADADEAALQQFEVHRARFSSVNAVYQCIADMKLRRPEDVSAHLRLAIDAVTLAQERIPSGPSGAGARKYLAALLEDVTGQISMALEETAAYNKWGKHFLPSIARAHLAQVCNNFKDPGVQLYGGSLFDSLRDRLHDLFCALPPPTPSSTPRYGNYGSHSVSRAPLNMASFANSSGACFHEDCAVTVCEDGSADRTVARPVRSVTRGDFVLTEGGHAVQVLYVLKTLCEGGVMAGVHFPETGLRLTHYHPMKQDGRWAFPRELNPNVEGFPCEAVYSFVLADPAIYTVQVNGTWCVSMGHSFAQRERTPTAPSADNRELLCHPYFGDRARVIADLGAVIAQQTQGAQGAGVAVITPDCIIRDASGGAIVGIRAPLGMDCVTTSEPAAAELSAVTRAAAVAVR
jgi:Mg-chelatase subunit ChlD